ncbi:MAG: phosphate acyltransferase PlsX [Tepidanaerobacteraceae bacterium]|jgi:glycerol-3-phosphate acyltransferase PlsX|nr:phosphate acyltransferase PlsX [Thermoanaerobacterales bacterium]
MRIIVDAMGGDKAPEQIIMGAVEASKELDAEIILIGDEKKIKPLLKEPSKIKEIIHAEEVITNDEKPVTAIRRKKQSSIVKGLKLVKDGTAQAMVSAGSTGALMAGGLFILGRLEGIDRPAIGTLFPSNKNPFLLLDIGANSEVKPQNLIQFALMGDLYAKEIMGKENPRIGLMNIGVEEEKGNSIIKAAYASLKQIKEINFIGNVETRNIFDGNVDVVVCDGFTGNIFLKTLEGFGSYIFKKLKKEIKSSITYSLGSMMMKPAMKRVKDSVDYSEFGGAMFLGVDGVLIKCHGSSDSRAIANGIKAASGFVNADISEKLKNSLKMTLEKEK